MVLIKNVKVIDGTGVPAYTADVLIKNDRILAVGDFVRHQAETIIDGSGGYLTPGFIDVNTDSDHYLTLFSDPGQKNFLTQGATTIIGGACGSSLAPLLYGSLESIRKWADISQINVDWHTVGEFLDKIAAKPLGVNFGTLIGHATVRRALIGEVRRDLTVNELRVFKKIVKDGLQEGAFGLSTGLSYIHAKQTPFYEIKELLEIVARHRGVYATHLRDEREKILESAKETAEIALETGATTIISHFRPLLGYESNFHKALEVIENSKAEIYFDSYPSDSSFMPIYALVPEWLKTGGLETMLEHLKDKQIQEKILRELPRFKPNDIIIGYAPAAKFLVGKSIGAIAKNRGSEPRRTLIEIMLMTKLRASVFYKNVNFDGVLQTLATKRALVASNAPGSDTLGEGTLVKHERLFNVFPKFLEISQQLKMMPLEKAVEKITSLPAKIFGLKSRGEIKPENFADLALIKDGQIRWTMVNGHIAVEDGVPTNVKAGRVLRKT